MRIKPHITFPSFKLQRGVGDRGATLLGQQKYMIDNEGGSIRGASCEQTRRLTQGLSQKTLCGDKCWGFSNLVVQTWLLAIFGRKRSFALFRALSRPSAHLHLRSLAVICARSFCALLRPTAFRTTATSRCPPCQHRRPCLPGTTPDFPACP